MHEHHAFLPISLPFLHKYDLKRPNFKFSLERERQGKHFYCIFLSSGAVFYLQVHLNFLILLN